MAQTDLINEGLLADYHDELMKDHIVGGTVFDISSYHATGTPPVLAEYANLAAALGTNGANVPESMRKGGMSVKFVSSSDNKYIQARCMAQNFTTDVTQWQGVDDEPTVGSKNLANSDGVAMRFAEFIGSPTEKTVSVQGTDNVPTGINLTIGKKYAIYVQCSTAVENFYTGVWGLNDNNEYIMIKGLSPTEFSDGITFEYTPAEDLRLCVKPNDTGSVVVKVWDLDVPITLSKINDKLSVTQYLLTESYCENGSITYDANGAISEYAVKWSDGTNGVYTATNWDANNQMYKGYEVTYGESYKLVQPAVTVSNYKITSIPEKQIVEL